MSSSTESDSASGPGVETTDGPVATVGPPGGPAGGPGGGPGGGAGGGTGQGGPSGGGGQGASFWPPFGPPTGPPGAAVQRPASGQSSGRSGASESSDESLLAQILASSARLDDFLVAYPAAFADGDAKARHGYIAQARMRARTFGLMVDELLQRQEGEPLDRELLFRWHTQRAVMHEQIQLLTEQDDKLRLLERDRLAAEELRSAAPTSLPHTRDPPSGPRGQAAFPSFHFKSQSLVVEPFEGDFAEFPNFKATFDEAYGKNPAASGLQKLLILKSCVKGLAAKAIAGLEIRDDNYPKAWALLQRHFGKPQLVVQNLLAKIHALDFGSRNSRELREAHLELVRLLEMLKGEGIVNSAVWVVGAVQQTMHRDLAESIERGRSEMDRWTVDTFLDALDKEITRGERMEILYPSSKGSEQSLRSDKPAAKESRRAYWQGQTEASSWLEEPPEDSDSEAPDSANAYAFQRPGRQGQRQGPGRFYCVYCTNYGEHYSEDCQVYATKIQRENFLTDNRRCQRCARDHHDEPTRICDATSCRHCRSKHHHRSICVKLFNEDGKLRSKRSDEAGDPGGKPPVRPATAAAHQPSALAHQAEWSTHLARPVTPLRLPQELSTPAAHCRRLSHDATVADQSRSENKPFSASQSRQSLETPSSASQSRHSSIDECGQTRHALVSHVSQEEPLTGATVATAASGGTGEQGSEELLTLPCLARVMVTNEAQNVASQEFVLCDTGCDDCYVHSSLADELSLRRSQPLQETCSTFGERLETSPFHWAHILIWLQRPEQLVSVRVKVKERLVGRMTLIPMAEVDEAAILPLPYRPFRVASRASVRPRLAINSDLFLAWQTDVRIVLPSGAKLVPHRLGDFLSGKRLANLPLAPLLGGGGLTAEQLGAHVRLAEQPEPTEAPLTLAPGEDPHSQPPLLTQAYYISTMTPTEELREIVLDSLTVQYLGIKESIKPDQEAEDQLALEFFRATTEMNWRNHRFRIRFPWKVAPTEATPSHKEQVTSIFAAFGKRLDRNPELKRALDQVFQKQLGKSIIERVTPDMMSQGHVEYWPSQHVYTPGRSTVHRMVFNGAFMGFKERLMRGPVRLPKVPEIMARFKTRDWAVLADLEGAFLHIEIQEADRNSTLFLWFEDVEKPYSVQNTATYRMIGMPFGHVFSPSFLGMGTDWVLESHSDPLAKLIQRDLYVDNACLTLDCEDDIINHVYPFGKAAFADCGWNLREWMSSSQSFMNSIPEADKARFKDGKDYVKVLGKPWRPRDDHIGIPPNKRAEDPRPLQTGRDALSLCNGTFDTEGDVAPIQMVAKRLFRPIAKRNWGLDADLTADEVRAWEELRPEMQKICSWWWPRQATPSSARIADLELHVFVDAALDAVAAVLFLRTLAKDGSFHVRRIAARTHAFEGNQLSCGNIHRAEILAIQVGLSLLNYQAANLRDFLDQYTDGQCRQFAWTDSTTAKHWAESRGKKKDRFVHNRVMKIQESMGETQLSYVRSEDNPADMAVRGCGAAELMSSEKWSHGPCWLSRPASNWPTKAPEPSDEEKERMEAQIVDETAVLTAARYGEWTEGRLDQVPLADPNRFSSAQKLTRITAYVLRALVIFKNSSTTRPYFACGAVDKLAGEVRVRLQRGELSGGPTALEMEMAEKLILLKEQARHASLMLHQCRKSPHSVCNLRKHRKGPRKRRIGYFIAPDGLLRRTDRLKPSTAGDVEAHPIFLPRSSQWTELKILDCHERLKHEGAATTRCEMSLQYSVSGGKRYYDKVLGERCLYCRHATGPPFVREDFGSYNQLRLNALQPWKAWAADFMGPFKCRHRNGAEIKVWSLIVSCQSTRLMHSQTLTDLTVSSVINALRKVIALKGSPSHVFTDCHKTLLNARKELMKAVETEEFTGFLAGQRIQWETAVARNPSQGGIYEKTVDNFKKCYVRTLRGGLPSLDEFDTLSLEICAAHNSRGLTVFYDEKKSMRVLRPIDLERPGARVGNPRFEALDTEWARQLIENQSEEDVLAALRSTEERLAYFVHLYSTGHLQNLRYQTEGRHRDVRGSLQRRPIIGEGVLIDDVPRPKHDLFHYGIVQRLLFFKDGRLKGCLVRRPNGRTIERPLHLLRATELSPSVAKAPDGSITAVEASDPNQDEELILSDDEGELSSDRYAESSEESSDGGQEPETENRVEGDKTLFDVPSLMSDDEDDAVLFPHHTEEYEEEVSSAQDLSGQSNPSDTRHTPQPEDSDRRPGQTRDRPSASMSVLGKVMYWTCLLSLLWPSLQPTVLAATQGTARRCDSFKGSRKSQFRLIHHEACSSTGLHIRRAASGEFCYGAKCKHGRLISFKKKGKANGETCRQCRCPPWAAGCTFPSSNGTNTPRELHFLSGVEPHLCINSSDPQCSDVSMTIDVNQVQLLDGTKRLVKTLNVEVEEVDPGQAYRCIGEGTAATGTKTYCEKNPCKRKAHRFCYQDRREAAYLSGAGERVGIMAWGRVAVAAQKRMREVRFLSGREECVSCAIECIDGALIRLSLPDDVHMVEVCSPPFCYTVMQPENGSLVQFPTELSLHDIRVEVKLWSQGRLQEVFGTNCRKQPLCHAIRCIWCMERLINPQCNVYAFLIFLLLVMYFGTQIVFVVMKLAWICTRCTRFSKRVTKCLYSTIKWGARKISRRPKGGGEMESSAAKEPAAKTGSQRIRASRGGRTSGKGLPKHMVLIVLALSGATSACSEVESLQAARHRCSQDSNATLSCSFSSTTRLTLVPSGQKSCLLVEDDQGNPLGSLQVSVKAITFSCQKTSLYYTRSFEMEVSSSRRCPHAGSCEGDKCGAVGLTTKLDEFTGAANDAIGFTYCAAGCSCATCGCFYCDSSCHFYRTFAKPRDDIVYEVFNCPSWILTATVNMELEDKHFIRPPSTNTTPSQVRAGEKTLKLVPGQREVWEQLEVTLVSATTLPVQLSKKFLSDGSRLASVEASARGQPAPNTVGVLQCSTEDKARDLDCTLPELCTCSTQEDSVQCSCPTPDLALVMADPENLLPLKTAGYTLKSAGSGVELEMAAMTALELQVTMEGKKFRSVVDRTQCRASEVSLVGCYNCLSGAVLDIICTTTFGSGQARAKCNGQRFTVDCNAQGIKSSITLNYVAAQVKEECSLICPGGSTTFEYSGTLLYVEQGQYTNFSNAIPNRGGRAGKGTNWESIWASVNNLFSTHFLPFVLGALGMIVAVIILILAMPMVCQLLGQAGSVCVRRLRQGLPWTRPKPSGMPTVHRNDSPKASKGD